MYIYYICMCLVFTHESHNLLIIRQLRNPLIIKQLQIYVFYLQINPYAYAKSESEDQDGNDRVQKLWWWYATASQDPVRVQELHQV